MKNLIKKYNKIVLFAGMLLFSYEAFSASEATKQMIQDTLSKFCIPPKKENCNPREEGKYDPNYDFCLCENDGMVYSKSGRKCVECGKGTYYKRNMKDNECKGCPAGTYSGSGASSCTPCPSGKYASGIGNELCVPCPSGHYSSGTGNSVCASCPAGYYASGAGNVSCVSCPRNHWSSPGSNSCYCDCTYGCDSNNNCLDYCDVHDCTPPEPEYEPDPEPEPAPTPTPSPTPKEPEPYPPKCELGFDMF